VSRDELSHQHALQLIPGPDPGKASGGGAELGALVLIGVGEPEDGCDLVGQDGVEVIGSRAAQEPEFASFFAGVADLDHARGRLRAHA